MLGFFALMIFIGIVIYLNRIDDRLRKVEKKMGISEKVTTPASVDDRERVVQQQISKQAGAVSEMKKEVSEPVLSHEPASQKSPEVKKEKMDLEHLFGAKFFSVLGVISIVLAVGFFTMWAFSNNLVGPMGRVIIGVIFSLIFLVLGELMRRKYPNFFYVVSAAGVAGLIISTYVAGVKYEFLTVFQSMICYSVEVGLGLLLSLRYDARFLGNFSIIGGLLAPLLVGSIETDPVGLLSFLVVLSVAGFFVAVKKNWKEIGAIMLLGVMFFETGIQSNSLLHDFPGIFIMFIWVLHCLVGFGGVLKPLFHRLESRDGDAVLGADVKAPGIFDSSMFVISIIFANLFMSFVFEQQGWEHLGYWILLEGVVLYVLSWIFKGLKMGDISEASLVMSMISLIFATIWEIGLSKQLMLTVALAIEGVFFYYLGIRFKKNAS
ncbi:DUF2339 domain-containing protein [Patescibacteria group bacterium]